MTPVVLALSGGLVESLGHLVGLAGGLVLVLALVALGTYAYKQLRGDGVEWPDEQDAEGVREGDDDEEWQYY